MARARFLIGYAGRDKFTFPVSFTTETCGILAKRGGGKSYTATVMAEGLLQNDQQVVVLDPLDAWWGLRSNANGKAGMFEIVIFGGEHGDVPLTRDMGAAVAKLVGDVLRYRPGLGAGLKTALQLFSVPAVVVNGRVISRRDRPADPDTLCHAIRGLLGEGG